MTSTYTPNPRFSNVAYEDAKPEVKEVYDDTMRTLQLPFVLNWFKCQGNNATLLKGNWHKLKNTLMEGEVPNVLKQLIIYNVSHTRGCKYCAKAHGIFANSMRHMVSDDPDFDICDLESPQIPSAYKIAIQVISKAALNPQDFKDEDYQKLVVAGFNNDEIQELLAQADLVNMLNTIADIAGIKVDNELLEAEQ